MSWMDERIGTLAPSQKEKGIDFFLIDEKNEEAETTNPERVETFVEELQYLEGFIHQVGEVLGQKRVTYGLIDERDFFLGFEFSERSEEDGVVRGVISDEALSVSEMLRELG